MSPEPHDARRILLVEDDELVREFLVVRLRRALPMAQVKAASSGREALDAYGSERPDLLITDLNLGGMSGADVIAAVRCVDRGLPILVITGAPDVVRVPGANEVVPKIRFAYLIERAVELLAGNARAALGSAERAG